MIRMMPAAENDPHPSLPMTGEPLYRRLAEHYRRVIQAGTLAPGERMPSVRALVRQHHVSLSTALQTFRHLEDAGWLEARPRSGYFVRPAPPSRPAGASEPDTRAVPAAECSAVPPGPTMGMNAADCRRGYATSRRTWRPMKFPCAFFHDTHIIDISSNFASPSSR